MKLGVNKQQKVREPNFSGKIPFSRNRVKGAKKGLKMEFFDHISKLCHPFFSEQRIDTILTFTNKI